MKKYLWIFIFFIIIVGIAVVLLNINNDNNKEEYIAKKTSNDESKENSTNDEIIDTNIKDNNVEELSSFSTKLPKDTKSRYQNIDLACNTLNGTAIKSGDIFSLWEVLGCPNKEKGYKKAKTFTSEGKVTKSYGGGICQVSTTIYNAVLEVDGLEILERHEHSRDVVYIKDGKDAAVSYDSADFKFKNTLDYDIELQAKLEDNKVKIKLIRI